MQLLKEQYARKVIHNVRSASLMMLNSYPRDGIFNLHLIPFKDSYGSEIFFLSPPYVDLHCIKGITYVSSHAKHEDLVNTVVVRLV